MEMQRLLYRMYVYAEDKSGVGGMEPNRVVVDNKDVTTQEQAELSSCKGVCLWMDCWIPLDAFASP